jgi:hypothetical protein
MIATLLMIGYLCYVSDLALRRYQYFEDPRNMDIPPLEYAYTCWLLLEMSIPVCMVLSSGLFFLGRYLFNESFIQT